MDVEQIKPGMPVDCSMEREFATVDHLDTGETIKLTRDEEGNHHWMPLAWVKRVDDRVHVDRPTSQAKQEWSTSSPAALRSPATLPTALDRAPPTRRLTRG
jgi:hypothetical protein